jgi:hypothetical protein
MSEEELQVKASLIKAAFLAREIDEIIRLKTDSVGEGLSTLAFAFYVMANGVGLTDVESAEVLKGIKEMVDGSIALAKQEAH